MTINFNKTNYQILNKNNIKLLIPKTIDFVKSKLQNAEGGHDWFHTERVWKTARKIAEKEGGDIFVIELAALLHDIADPKFHDGDENLALKITEDFLNENAVERKRIDAVLFIIKYMSFKNRQEAPENLPLELQIVQDADRLDAIGAIGIARAFNFGGFKNNPMHDPEIQYDKNFNKEKYKQSHGTTINHFHEKLLLLKDLMNTPTAKEMAQHRHNFMLQFLDEFHREWSGGAGGK